jgi:catechol-2,3-dioxygenase
MRARRNAVQQVARFDRAHERAHYMAMTDTLMLGKVQQIALVQHDVERATAFYRDALGLTLQFAMAGMAFFDAGGVRLMLTKPSAPEGNVLAISEARAIS